MAENESLSGFFRVQVAALQTDLTQTRAELKEVTRALTQLEVQLARIDAQNVTVKHEELQKRVSQFEKVAVTDSDLEELRKSVADLVAESTGRKAQARVLKWGVAALSAINLVLLIYLNWKKV